MTIIPPAPESRTANGMTIAECMRRAQDARTRADQAEKPDIRADAIAIAETWEALAVSMEKSGISTLPPLDDSPPDATAKAAT